ncbi:MAG: universal stress protein [Verrucomicrobiota bacterium]
MANDPGPKVLLIGLRSDSVDYEKWPQLTPEKLEAAFADVLAELKAGGYRGAWCLTDRGQTAAETVRRALETEQPDLVVVGAGVRTDPDHFLLFESVINLIHEHAPRARIAFNTLPFDTVDAVKRWI